MGQAVGKAALRTAWYNVVGSFPLQKGGNHERNGASCIDGASSHSAPVDGALMVGHVHA